MHIAARESRQSWGSRDDFDAFYQAAWGGVVAHAYALTADLGDAEEVAQEAFTRAWQRWRQISRYDEPKGWVTRVAHNLAVSRWRRARTATAALVRIGAPPSVPEPSPDSLVLVAALGEINPDQRRAVVLHHLSGLSVAEVAEVEGVAVGTVKARLSRGRAALAKLLDGDRDGDGFTHRPLHAGAGPGAGAERPGPGDRMLRLMDRLLDDLTRPCGARSA
ncbi:MAG: SigE family RNA polymerase sigma factor [Nocardioidaceae bacterium]